MIYLCLLLLVINKTKGNSQDNSQIFKMSPRIAFYNDVNYLKMNLALNIFEYIFLINKLVNRTENFYFVIRFLLSDFFIYFFNVLVTFQSMYIPVQFSKWLLSTILVRWKENTQVLCFLCWTKESTLESSLNSLLPSPTTCKNTEV